MVKKFQQVEFNEEFDDLEAVETEEAADDARSITTPA